jgi:hypothetical protein
MSWSMVSLDGQRGFKSVPCRLPPIRHFQRIADPRDWDLLDAVEAMTDAQAREEIGQTELFPAHERFRACDAAPIVAAFTTFDPAGSPLSDGSVGVFYLHLQQDAAIAAAQRESAAFLAASCEGPIKLSHGLYSIGLAGKVADLRRDEAFRRKVPARDAGNELHRLGSRLRAAGVAGALYPGTGLHSTDALAVFNPSVLTDCVACAFVELEWNGHTMDKATVVAAVR